MERLILPLLILCAQFPAAAFSIFSIDSKPGSLNTGESAPAAEPRLRAMGGAGRAFADSVNYTLENPATLAAVDATIIGLTYAPEFTQLLDAGGAAAYRNFSEDFPQGELVWPLGRYGTLCLAHQRDRVLQYDIHYGDSQGYSVHQFGSGGTYALLTGYAFRVSKRLSLGITAGRLYGKTVHGNFIESQSSGAGLPASFLEKERFSATVLEAGAHLPWGPVAVGLSLRLPVGTSEIKREGMTISHFSTGDSLVPTIRSSQEADFEPLKAAFGLAWKPNKQLKWAADLSAARFSIDGRGTDLYAGSGVEYAFAGRRADNYFLNIPLRAGLFYHDPGYPEAVHEFAGTFGFTLPTAYNYGLLHFAVEGGLRRSPDFDFSERFVRISVQMLHKGRWGRLRTSVRGESQAEEGD